MPTSPKPPRGIIFNGTLCVPSNLYTRHFPGKSLDLMEPAVTDHMKDVLEHGQLLGRRSFLGFFLRGYILLEQPGNGLEVLLDYLL